MIAAEKHLSDEQLDEILMEIAEPAAEAHASGCALCSARLDEFRASMASFNQASLAWSEARSNTLTRDLRTHRLIATVSRTTLWSCVSAGALVAALVFTAGVEHRGSPHDAGFAPAAASDYASSRMQEIANDNAMLAAISSEIERPIPAPSLLDDQGQSAQSSRGGLRQARD